MTLAKEVIPGHKLIKNHWKTNKGKDAVLLAIQLCHTECGLSATDIDDHREAIALEGRYLPSIRTIDRLIRDESPIRSAAHVLGLLLIASDVFNGQSDPSAKIKSLTSLLDSHIAILRDRMGDAFPAVKQRKRGEPTKLPAASLVPAVDVIALIQQFLGVSSGAFDEMNRVLFGMLRTDPLPERSVEKYFNMYRFHGEPGKVVKTFTVLKSPIVIRPFAMFTNFFCTGKPAETRRSDGIIIPTEDYLYFVGGVGGGVGLKLIALERKPHTKLHLYHGLTITFDQNEDMVAARCILLPTEDEHHEKAGANVYAIDDVDDVIRDHLDELRNHIPFKLEQNIKLDGKSITQRQLVNDISELLESGSGPRLVFDDGGEFNPADHQQYTFNAALKHLHSK